MLLSDYMVAHAKSDAEKLYYLGQVLELIRGTFFRQTMFAEFQGYVLEADAQLQTILRVAMGDDMESASAQNEVNATLDPKVFKKPCIADFAEERVREFVKWFLQVTEAMEGSTLEVKDLIENARANPGKFSYATPNSTSLVSSETIRVMAKIDILGIPYKSSPQALTDLIGGQVQMYVVDFGSGLPSMKAGKVRVLASMAAKRSSILPEVPPMADTLPGFDLISWNGIFGPAALPRPIVERLANEIQALLAEKDVQEKLANIGFEVSPSKSPEEFSKYVSDQLALWSRLIRQANIQPE
jgi:hypothetical protein